MIPQAFIQKWQHVALKKRLAAQEHFIDLCRLLNEPTPAEADSPGTWYSFEKGAKKAGDGDGLGRHYRITWRGRLPHTLTFQVKTTRRVWPVRIKGWAEGQLQGVGVWRLQHHSDGRGDQSRVVWPIREARQCARAVDEFLMGSGFADGWVGFNGAGGVLPEASAA